LFLRTSTGIIDCRVEKQGQRITTTIVSKDVEFIVEDEVKFIVVVEKRGMLHTLVHAKLWEHLPFIIVSTGGNPDVTVRRFVNKLANLTTAPVVAFTDWDVSGFSIMSIFRFGTIAMAYDCARLTTPRMKWLGLRSVHVAEYVVRI
jgi:meiotic recombination protein SPO11